MTTPFERQKRLDAIGEALHATAELSLDGRRREIDELYAQLLYSALMRIRSHAREHATPAETRCANIGLICDAALGVDGPPAPRKERT